MVEQQYTHMYVKSYGEAYSMEIFMSSTTAQMNHIHCLTSPKSQNGMFHFVQVNAVNISGTSDLPSTFTNNTGSVVLVKNTCLYLFGNIHFNGNYGNNGAAISLYQESTYFS